MKTQKAELIAQLPQHGWQVAHIEEQVLEWWADEMWVLESTWSPVGQRAYMTFLIDPMSYNYGGVQKKGQGVWAVLASEEIPVDWSHSVYEEGYFTLDLKGWKERLPAFFEFLARVRNAGRQPEDL